MQNFILTDNIIRDKLAIYGNMGVRELTQSLGLQYDIHHNLIMSHLINLMRTKQVEYDIHNGCYKSLVVLR